jgi:Xaa-Pro aminopeptidase
LSSAADLREGALARIRDALAARGVDALWVESSVNLRYLTGLALLSLERPCGLLVPARGEPRMLVPLLLGPETSVLPVERLVWADHEGHEDGLRKVLGDVRSCYVQPALPAAMCFSMRAVRPGLEIEIDPGIMASLRVRKDARELAGLRRAARLADETAAWLGELDLAGYSERALEAEIAIRFLRAGAGTYDYIIATGPNAAVPHHRSGDDPIAPDRPLLADFGCVVDGYHSDMTRMYFPEALEPEVQEAYAVVCEAYDAVLAMLRPGVTCEDADRAARDVIEAAGHGEHFLSRTGHGIGLEIHEEPYLRSGGTRTLEAGHVFSVEPSIAVAGRFGVRYENIVHLGPDGPEPLNAAPRSHALSGSRARPRSARSRRSARPPPPE